MSFAAFSRATRKVSEATGLTQLTARLTNKPSGVRALQDLSAAEWEGMSWKRSDKGTIRTIRTGLPYIGMAFSAGGATAFLLTVMNSRKATMKSKK